MYEKIKIDDLLTYEAPSIGEWISIDWIQNIIARYLARKINRKIKRYNARIKREQYIRSITNPN